MVTQAQYEKALERAHSKRLVVRSHGTSEGEHIFWVENPNNEPGSWYTVRLPKGARVMSCNCLAGQNGQYCCHRASVHEHMLAQGIRV